MSQDRTDIEILTATYSGQEKVIGYYVTVTDRQTDGQPEVARMAARIRRATGKHIRRNRGKVWVQS